MNIKEKMKNHLTEYCNQCCEVCGTEELLACIKEVEKNRKV